MNYQTPHRHFVVIALTTSVLLAIIILGLMDTFSDKLPAPRISSSESFNEKARWIRQTNPQCDILIIGSSIALNNVDGVYLSKLTGKPVANFSSFGLTPTEVANQLARLPKGCRPKAIIYPFFREDLIGRWDKMIDWQAYERFLNQESYFLAYAKNMDLPYYISTAFKRSVHKRIGNRSFQSLDFDNSGSVMLSDKNFQYDQGRWGAYAGDKKLSNSQLEQAISGIKQVDQAANALGAKLILVSTPLNPESKKYYQGIDQELWIQVKQYANEKHIEYLNLNSSNNSYNEAYTDFVHMNERGAKIVSDQIIGTQIR